MLRRINVAAQVGWLAGITLIAVTLSLPSPAAGQAAADRPLQAPFADASHAKQAHILVEQWLAAGQVDAAAAPKVPATGAVGVYVTLRKQGQEVGYGQAIRPDLAEAAIERGNPADVGALAAAAATQAIESFRQTLADARLEAINRGANPAMLKQPSVAEQASLLSVDVQLAYDLKPIELAPNAGLAELFATFAPHYHGLRLARAEGGDAWSWPALAITRNTTARSQLIQLLSELNYTVVDLKHVAKPDGPRLWRFRVFHVVRPRPGMAVLELTRGSVPMPVRGADMATLGNMADRLASHLARRVTQDAHVNGTFHPSNSTYRPAVGSRSEAAMAAFAFSRASGMRSTTRERAAGMGGELHRAELLVRRIAADLPENPGSEDIAAAALCVLTIVDAPRPIADDRVRDSLAAYLLKRHDGEGRFVLPQEADAGPEPAAPPIQPKTVNAVAASVATFALAALYEQTGQADALEAAWLSLARQWAESGGNPPIHALPWLASARERLKPFAGESVPAAARPIVERIDEDLLRLIARLSNEQVIEAPALGPTDAIGGFELSNLPPGAPPEPNWKTAELLAFLAIVMRDEQLVPPDRRFGPLLTATLAARFVAQLMVNEPDCFYVLAAPDAMGGLRNSLTDNRIGIVPTASALVAIAELERTVRAMEPPRPAAPASDD